MNTTTDDYLGYINDKEFTRFEADAQSFFRRVFNDEEVRMCVMHVKETELIAFAKNVNLYKLEDRYKVTIERAILEDRSLDCLSDRVRQLLSGNQKN